MPKASADAFPAPDRKLSYVIDDGTPLDLSPGAIEPTGNPLDVAIKGDGFLVVRTPAGERYTRNGALDINSRGELATSDGHVVVGERGPIIFQHRDRLRHRRRRHGDRSSRATGAASCAWCASASPACSQRRRQPVRVERRRRRPPAPRRARRRRWSVPTSSPSVEMSRVIEVNRSYASLAAMLQRDELRRSAISRLAESRLTVRHRRRPCARCRPPPPA